MALLFSDPLYLTTVVNTLLFVGIGVNVKMFLAFLLSGFFMSRSWWIRALLAIYLIPWALPAMVVFTSIHFMLVTQWGLLDSLWRAVTGHDGPLFLIAHWVAMGGEHRRLYLEVDAVLDAGLPRRAAWRSRRTSMKPPRSTAPHGIKRLIYVTFPLLANVYLVSTLLSTVWTLGDFPTVYFVTSGAPGMSTERAGDATASMKHSTSATRSSGLRR